MGRDNEAVVSAAIVNGGVELTERGTGTAKLVLTAKDRAGRRLSKVVYVKVNKAIQQPGEGLDQAADLAVEMVLAGVAAQQPGKVRLHSVKLDEGFSRRAIDPADVFDDYDAGKTVLSARVISQAQGYQWTMTAYAAAAIALFLVTFFGTRERVRPDPRQETSLKQDLADLVRNGPWLALVVVSFFKLIFLAIRTGSVVYYCKYFAGSENARGMAAHGGHDRPGGRSVVDQVARGTHGKTQYLHGVDRHRRYADAGLLLRSGRPDRADLRAAPLDHVRPRADLAHRLGDVRRCGRLFRMAQVAGRREWSFRRPACAEVATRSPLACRGS